MSIARGRTPYGVVVALLAALGVLPMWGGCGGDADPASAVATFPGDGISERRLLARRWDTVFQVGGSLADTLLQHPVRMTAGFGGVVVADAHARRVLRFDTRGRLEWIFGRGGSGPGEFLRLRDLALDREGRTWVLDPDNGRLTVVGRRGTLVATVPLVSLEARAEHVVPLPGDEVLLVTLDPEAPLVRIDMEGEVLERLPFPWPGHEELPALATQLTTNSDPATGRWVAGYVFGPGFFVFEGARRLAARQGYVEAVPFPRVVVRRTGNLLGRGSVVRRLEAPEPAAVSSAVDGDRVVIHFEGRTEQRLRLLDTYSAVEGSYRGTHLLPGAVDQVEVAGDIFFVLYNRPFPTLAAWRPTASP